MSSKRIRRPLPARVAPRRAWRAGPADAAPPSADGNASPTPDPAPGGPRERIESTVSKSVELGYKVIDEYLQQGQQTAQRLNAGTLTAQAMATEAQDLGARVARYASDFFGAWMELLEMAAAGRAAKIDGTPAATPAGTDGTVRSPAPEPAAGRAPAPSRVEVEVLTGRPARLRLDLHADRMNGPLLAHALRSADPRCGRIEGVATELDGDTPRVRVHVPDGQRAGSYEGLLIDERTNRPVGSLRITLERARGCAQPSAPSKAPASSASPSSKPSSKRR